MREVVIASYLRTAQSRSRPSAPDRDWFHRLRADELLARRASTGTAWTAGRNGNPPGRNAGPYSEKAGGRLGCACACIGGGQGVATIIEI